MVDIQKSLNTLSESEEFILFVSKIKKNRTIFYFLTQYSYTSFQG